MSYFHFRIYFILGLIAVFLLSPLILQKFLSQNPQDKDEYFCQTAEKWREKYGDDPDYIVARIDVNLGSPREKDFQMGMLIAYPGLDLIGAQQVVEIVSYPKTRLTKSFEGIHYAIWDYATNLYDDREFSTLTLARRLGNDTAAQGQNASSVDLSDLMKLEAGWTIDMASSHYLKDCESFKQLLQSIPGEITDPVLRWEYVFQSVKDITQKSPAFELHGSFCDSIKSKELSFSAARIVATYAARELGLPSYGFDAATEDSSYIIGIWFEKKWRWYDLRRKENPIPDPAVLLTRAPILPRFSLDDTGFWSAYAKFQDRTVTFEFVSDVPPTLPWKDTVRDPSKSPHTRAATVSLREYCR